MKRLEHEPDLLITPTRLIGRAQVRRILSVEAVRSIARDVEQPDDVHQRGLARAGRPDNRDKFPAIDAKRHVIKRPDGFAGGPPVRLSDVLQLDHA
jgi:hypothetical protein